MDPSSISGDMGSSGTLPTLTQNILGQPQSTPEAQPEARPFDLGDQSPCSPTCRPHQADVQLGPTEREAPDKSQVARFEYGRSDWDPFANPSTSGAAGMLMGPQHPGFHDPRSTNPPRFPYNGIPPGAQFIPVTPMGPMPANMNPSSVYGGSHGFPANVPPSSMPFSGEPDFDDSLPPGQSSPFPSRFGARGAACLRLEALPLTRATLQYRHIHSSAFILSPSKRDPYDVLSVDKNANTSAIKKSYFELAKKYHPDTYKEPGGKEKFIEVQEAYEILSDEQKRAAYDRHGHVDESMGSGANAGGGPFSAAGGPGNVHFDPADIFRAFFGGSMGGESRHSFGGSFGGRRGMNFPSLDIQATLRLTFMEAAKGTVKSASYKKLSPCQACDSSGSRSKKPSICKSCQGSGTKVFTRGGMIMQMVCNECEGEGQSIQDPCPVCDGLGSSQTTVVEEIKIPPGVDSETVLNVKGAGHQVKKEKGSLQILFEVSPSQIFSRSGKNIQTTIKIPFTTAILGGTVTVPTIWGDVEMIVPSGTQPSDNKKLRGKGIHPTNATPGDQIVTFTMDIPKKITPNQKAALETFIKDASPGATTKEEHADEESHDKKSRSNIKDWLKSKFKE